MENTVTGKVLSAIRGEYKCHTAAGTIPCKSRGKFFIKDKIAIGDNVRLDISDPDNIMIEEVYERKSLFPRPFIANADMMVVVIAADMPKPDYLAMDKLTAMTSKHGIPTHIIVNKTDLAPPDEIAEIYGKAGYRVIPVCANTGEGIDEAVQLLEGKTAILTGSSGVGKSSILNAIGFSQRVGGISKLNRGQHTTTHISLMPYRGGYIGDTPGFSLFEISGIDKDDLRHCFVDIDRYDSDCEFTGCRHINTKPHHCAVAAAVERGDISHVRYNNYAKIYETLTEGTFTQKP